MMKRRSSSKVSEDDAAVVVKHRRITRSVTRKIEEAKTSAMFETIAGPVLSSGYLRWHEAENLGRVSKGCRYAWKEQKEGYEDWELLLKELNMMNCTNRCCNCEQVILLKANRRCCSVEQWNRESAKRTPDFHGVVDLIMSSGVLNWREKGGIRRISKTCYKVHKEQCCCRPEERTKFVMPFLQHDPRYSLDYYQLTDYRKCVELSTYTTWMIQNLHSYYNFAAITDASKLPYGLEGWAWFDVQMVTLQRRCPRRYSFVMNMVSLFMAQGELQRAPPKWYASAFLGEKHDPVTGAAYEETLGSGISEFCLPATDEVLCRFLQNKCYPSNENQKIIGPLVQKLSIFAPFFRMVPLSSNMGAKLPRGLERLTDEMIDSMSLHFFCTIS
jgi:hypothetical protein